MCENEDEADNRDCDEHDERPERYGDVVSCEHRRLLTGRPRAEGRKQRLPFDDLVRSRKRVPLDDERVALLVRWYRRRFCRNDVDEMDRVPTALQRVACREVGVLDRVVILAGLQREREDEEQPDRDGDTDTPRVGTNEFGELHGFWPGCSQFRNGNSFATNPDVVASAPKSRARSRRC